MTKKLFLQNMATIQVSLMLGRRLGIRVRAKGIRVGNRWGGIRVGKSPYSTTGKTKVAVEATVVEVERLKLVILIRR